MYKNIEELIEKGKLEEAKKALEELFAIPEDKKEVAHNRAALVAASIKLINAYHRAYSAALAEVISQGKELKDAQRRAKEALHLAEVRAKLG